MDRTQTHVIGNENCVLGFGLVGVEGQVVRSKAEMEQALATSLADARIGILLISSDAAALAPEQVDHLKVSSMLPLVVEIPAQGAVGAGSSLRDFVQRAVGVKLGGV